MPGTSCCLCTLAVLSNDPVAILSLWEVAMVRHITAVVAGLPIRIVESNGVDNVLVSL